MRSFALLFLLAPLASAQGAVHVVGSGGAFSEIQPAIDAAADGDVVLVRQGAYGAFTIDGKGVSVIADEDDDVLVAGQIQVSDVPAGSLAVLRGLATGERSLHGVRVRDCAGAVRVEECALAGQDGIDATSGEDVFHGAYVSTSGAVLLARCTLAGGEGETVFPGWGSSGGSGVRVSDASVAIVDCTLIGANAADADYEEAYDGGDGGNGVVAWKANLWISGVTAHGGYGGWGGYEFDFISGEVCGYGGYGGSGVRVVDSEVGFGVNPASSTVVLRDLTAFPAPGGGSDCGHEAADGEDVTILEPALHDVTMLPGAAPGAWASSPARAGTNARVYVRGEPGDLAIVGFGPPAPFLALPGQPLPLATTPQVSVVIGALPPSGLAVQPIPVPAIPASGLTLGLQGVIVPASGAGFELAPFGTITLLDPAL